MKKDFIIIVLALIIIPLSCQAFFLEELFEEIDKWFSIEDNGSQIINEVNVSTDTGGNIVEENGEVKEGETKSQVYVRNIINGEEIEPIEIETEANEVKVKSEIEVEEGKALVQREIEIDSEKSEESYEVDLEDSGTCKEYSIEEELKEGQEYFYDWWSDFVEGLKSFFQNIFNF